MEQNELNIDLHDRILEAYYGKLGEQLMTETRRRIHWICSNVKGKKILDVGCSQGIVPILLGREGKNVTGLDISQKAIDEANNQLSKEEIEVKSNVEFIRANFLLHDFGKEKFDTIIIAEVLEHLINPQEFIDKAKELLNENGVLIITVPFGINDFIDHKKTYYLHDLYVMLFKDYHINNISILKKWIGIVALKSRKPSNILTLDLLKKVEEAFYTIERNLIDENKKLYGKLKDSNEKYMSITKKEKELKLQNKNHEKVLEEKRKVIKQLQDTLKLQNKNHEKVLEEKRKVIKQLQDEKNYKDKMIEDMKNELNALKRELSTARRYKKYLDECKNSASFRLGHLLIHELRSIKDLLVLPKKVLDIKSKKIYKYTPCQHNVKRIDGRLNLKKSKKFTTQKEISKLKIAAIMDTFTYNAYSNEAEFLQLTPKEWKNELDSFSPDLLFVESAWRGKDELWWNAVGKKCKELVGIVDYCNKHKIPTVFWNKEDPVHFNTFINTAALFDFVFTTDIDMIEKYKSILGHERVYLLPFACQPKVNNPIEKYKRKDKFCFAGAYYARYPDRTKDLKEFLLYLPQLKPIEIYDRNYGKDDPNYMFPEQFKQFIVGTLPFEEIDKAYKGYNYAINLNSIKQSQSMFARRVFEVLASNTITVSNFSKAVRLLFGDLVITSDNALEIIKRINNLQSDKVLMRKHKLIALRKVLSEHTYKDRLAYVVSKVFQKEFQYSLPTIQAVCFVKTEEDYARCLNIFDKQVYKNKKLLLIEDGFSIPKSDNNYSVLNINGKHSFNKHDFSNIDYLAFINPHDYYGVNYLMDLSLANRYFDGQIIGKASYYELCSDGKIMLNNDKKQYTLVDSVPLYTSIVKKEVVFDVDLKLLNKITQSSDLGSFDTLSIDEFNYCQNGFNLSKDNMKIVEAKDIDNSGISIKKLFNCSDKIQIRDRKALFNNCIAGELFIKSIKKHEIQNVNFIKKGSQVIIESTIPSNEHLNIYNTDFYRLHELGFSMQQKVYLDTTAGLDLQLIVIYYDSKKQKISHQYVVPNKNSELIIPKNCEWISFGFRVASSGIITLHSLELNHRVLTPAILVGQSKYLVLTNMYPSYDNLYRNGFVHARIRAYKKSGVNVDVFSLDDNQAVLYREFENVDVTTGAVDALRNLLENNNYKSILVHFLNEKMWSVLKDFVDKVKIFVWVHGAEIQPWHRRQFNYSSQEELNNAKILSDKRMKFWKSVLKSCNENLKLIFVSKYFLEEVEQDLNLTIPDSNKVVIHNYIDTDLFSYFPKNIEQRKKILSIRPYANKAYANDLSVQAILELSNKSHFNELEFRIIGDGVLFEETVKPLRKFNNVIIEKRFLTHAEIAALHKEYGVFLCPTRTDTQGVSRGEAMSSGLVPITNAVAAIPEFVDEECGILAKAEDAHGLAQGIDKLYNNPDLFLKMSESAAKRVRRQCGYEYTIKKEMELFDV